MKDFIEFLYIYIRSFYIIQMKDVFKTWFRNIDVWRIIG